MFTPADENKINSMLAETDRNREMCNQIVSRVFPDPNETDALTHSVGPLVSVNNLSDSTVIVIVITTIKNLHHAF